MHILVATCQQTRENSKSRSRTQNKESQRHHLHTPKCAPAPLEWFVRMYIHRSGKSVHHLSETQITMGFRSFRKSMQIRLKLALGAGFQQSSISFPFCLLSIAGKICNHIVDTTIKAIIVLHCVAKISRKTPWDASSPLLFAHLSCSLPGANPVVTTGTCRTGALAPHDLMPDKASVGLVNSRLLLPRPPGQRRPLHVPHGER